MSPRSLLLTFLDLRIWNLKNDFNLFLILFLRSLIFPGHQSWYVGLKLEGSCIQPSLFPEKMVRRFCGILPVLIFCLGFWLNIGIYYVPRRGLIGLKSATLSLNFETFCLNVAEFCNWFSIIWFLSLENPDELLSKFDPPLLWSMGDCSLVLTFPLLFLVCTKSYEWISLSFGCI